MKVGKQTYLLDNKVYIQSAYSLAGPYEAKGNFRDYFDCVMEDDEWKCKSHEMAEIEMQRFVIGECLSKVNVSPLDCGAIMGGDLINQIVPTSFSARDFHTPFMGLYNACATFGEALAIGSTLVGGDFDKIICCTSSHYATAERQYRYPLELGTQPTPESQWTVTGSGAVLLSKKAGEYPLVKGYTIGRVLDFGLTDPNNMGGAMAPAAANTIVTHFKDTGRSPDYYDLIITGDLGRFGRETLHYLCKKEGYELNNLNDCGSMMYCDKQKAGQGGSGAGCCSLVFASYLYKKLVDKSLKKILFVPTGAMLSKDSALQGESIPGIAHAVIIEREDWY